MKATTELLRPNEVAVISCVRLRDVNRAIDELILPEALIGRNRGRWLKPEACTFLAFYFESADRLTSEERVLTIRTIWDRLAHKDLKPSNVRIASDWVMHHEFLSIDLRAFAKRTKDGLCNLEAARKRVSVTDDVLGGTPVFHGTRVPVRQVAALMAANVPPVEILEDYPGLDRKDLELAVLYAKANPPRGRPRPLLANLPDGTKLRSERRVTRKS